MILIIEFFNRQWHISILTLGPRSRIISAMKFYVQSTYFSFQISKIIFFFLDHNSVHQNLILDTFYLFAIFPLLFSQLSNQHIFLVLQILEHHLFFFWDIQVVMINIRGLSLQKVSHKFLILIQYFELSVCIFYILFYDCSIFCQLLFGFGFLLQSLNWKFNGLVICVISGDKLELVPINSQWLNLIFFSAQN